MHQPLRFVPSLLSILLFLCVRGASAADGGAWPTVGEQAADRFGEPGAEAAAFLAGHRPERDADIDPELVVETIGLALRARETFPWARTVQDDLFLNDVLPYAVLDEPRVRSRARLLELSAPIVAGASDAAEAAQRLNRDLFAKVGVRYSTARGRANQNALETMESGMASCTGLSILLIEACRSVGIPARMAGVASWPGRGGNHAWVEIHDGERWRFLGAAEYDAAGLDRAWFTGQAAAGVPGHALHGVWATSWRTTGDHYVLVWNPEDRSVPGVDVTNRYARPAAAKAEPVLAVRLWASRGGPRIAADVTLGGHADRTHADPDDINLVAELPDPGDRPVRLAIAASGESRSATIDRPADSAGVIDLYWDQLSLSEDGAAQAAERLWTAHADPVRAERAAELDAMKLAHDGFELALLRKDFGTAPDAGPSLWISMHGGGGAPAEVNDQQWRNQIRLYEPEEGIYIAPRAPSDTWNMWHRPEVDALFDRLVESAVIAWGVDPNRVYLMGYSAGGDGVYQLAPRMADRFAAAAMMAGHPNNARPEGLRNLPFALFMGGEDAAFNRNTVAQQWADRLAELKSEDPQGYTHFARIYPGLPHWMDRKDAEGVPWMAAHTRDPWPDTVVWRQGNTPHARFYWLSVPESEAAEGKMVRASVTGQTIALTTEDYSEITLLLSDALLDLDEPITVTINGREVFGGRVDRTEQAIAESIRRRPDPAMIATAVLRVPMAAD